MKDFEQWEKEARENKITISKVEFIEKAAEVCAEEARTSAFPLVATFASIIVAKLTIALFDKKDNGEEGAK